MTTSMDIRGWRDELKLQLEALVDAFLFKGARQEEIFDAISDELNELREALARDPGPAGDNSNSILEEPTNDWPGALSEKE